MSRVYFWFVISYFFFALCAALLMPKGMYVLTDTQVNIFPKIKRFVYV